ncbi:PKD domain-containing protein [Actinoplanes sp. M2I2]|uniref:PKD domain-containing protein n=1 Tax=Actinoplanes sp. M2I2 TaxID=1734444 RepID=UPI0020203AFA|nr:PKD domain-containing protein [Actinoplanes sp. M2I2]
MNSRLSRPLLAAVVSGAFLVGGGVFAAPALADPLPASTELPTKPTPEEPTSPTTSPTSTEGVPTPPPPPTDDEETEEPTTAPTTTAPTTPTSEPTDETTPPPATTPPASPTTTPPTSTPPADTVAPSGSLSLNRSTIYPGQSVTLTLSGIKDNVSTPAQIKRVINWGDGYSAAVSSSATSVAHTYKSSGKKPITLTLTDTAGNKKVVKSAGPTVTSATVKYKLSKTSVLHGQRFVWEITGVPAGATKIAVGWGEGRSSILQPKKQKVTRYYYFNPNNQVVTPGVKTLKATVFNKYGGATPQVVGKVTLKKDGSRPVVKIIQPSRSNKASSWKAIKGTATDKGSGIKETLAFAILGKSNGTVLCYSSSKKKWITAPTNAAACLIPVKVSKGKFSVPLKSTPKGYLIVEVIAQDWAGLTNPRAMVEKNLS